MEVLWMCCQLCVTQLKDRRKTGTAGVNVEKIEQVYDRQGTRRLRTNIGLENYGKITGFSGKGFWMYILFMRAFEAPGAL